MSPFEEMKAKVLDLAVKTGDPQIVDTTNTYFDNWSRLLDEDKRKILQSQKLGREERSDT